MRPAVSGCWLPLQAAACGCVGLRPAVSGGGLLLTAAVAVRCGGGLSVRRLSVRRARYAKSLGRTQGFVVAPNGVDPLTSRFSVVRSTN